MSDVIRVDYEQLEKLVHLWVSHDTFEEMEDDIGCQIHGISLPSFLQMAEMEKSTFTRRLVKEYDFLQVCKGPDVSLPARLEMDFRFIGVQQRLHAAQPWIVKPVCDKNRRHVHFAECGAGQSRKLLVRYDQGRPQLRDNPG